MLETAEELHVQYRQIFKFRGRKVAGASQYSASNR